jgi:FKBP-type peptidyl-prolyl cis-trans isomerase FklB
MGYKGNSPSPPQTRMWIRVYRTISVLLSALSIALVGCADPCASPAHDAVIAQAAAEEGAMQTESGLVLLVLRPGTGPKPTVDNRVQVHYQGRLADGTVFDSSYKRGHPAAFELTDVIPGWTEGLQLLAGGGKARLTIPARLAYGKKGKSPKIPPCAPLIFDVELLGIYD